MNDIRPALRSFLLAESAITALVASRIYPMVLPQGIKDSSVVYSRISARGDHHMQGPSGLAQERIQIDAWATTVDAATVLAAAIKERLDGFSGQMGAGAVFVPVRGMFFESLREDYDEVARLYRVSQDYFIWYAER